MNILIDMNLSPQWVAVLVEAGHRAIHWSKAGATHATDHEIMTWARSNAFIVFTHDSTLGRYLQPLKHMGPA